MNKTVFLNRLFFSILLRCWFYNPKEDSFWGGSLLNKTVAFVDGPWCHCELQFPDGSALAIYQNSRVQLKNREFDVTRYSCLPLDCTNRQVMLARDAAERAVQNKLSFGFGQAFAALCKFSYQGYDGYTFCSKLIAEVLQDAGILLQEAPRSPTPSQLYTMLQTTKPTQHTVFNALKEQNINLSAFEPSSRKKVDQDEAILFVIT